MSWFHTLNLIDPHMIDSDSINKRNRIEEWRNEKEKWERWEKCRQPVTRRERDMRLKPEMWLMLIFHKVSDPKRKHWSLNTKAYESQNDTALINIKRLENSLSQTEVLTSSSNPFSHFSHSLTCSSFELFSLLILLSSSWRPKEPVPYQYTHHSSSEKHPLLNLHHYY